MPRHLLAALGVASLVAGGTASAAATPAAATPSAHWTVTARDAVAGANARVGATVTLADRRAHPTSQRGPGGVGRETFAAHRLALPVQQVTATVSATRPAGSSVTVELRGRRAGGPWTPWFTVSGGHADLGRPVDAVQAQVVLTSTGAAAPAVRSIDLTAAPLTTTTRSAAATPAASAPLTSTIFATREGLVGGTTANGHVIQPNDHFVALPSGVALDSNGAYDYQVQVCNGSTCLTEPVWDIGPWNTHDDYWDSPRAEFNDLPQGTPEAQAAYTSGYNGGQDEFGRTVANPAGIDLADGVFYDLGLPDNGYVTVTYLWTSGSTTPTGPNVVSDPGFEDTGTGPWQCVQTCGVDHGLGNQHTGTSNGWARHDSGWVDIHQTVTVQPDTDYQLSGWLRTSDNSDNGFFGVRTTGGTVIGEAHYTNLYGYQYVTVNLNTGSNTSVVVYGGVWTDHGDIWLQIDDVSLASL